MKQKTPKFGRRAAIASGVLLSVGAIAGFLRTRGYEISDERASSLRTFSAWQLTVVTAVARRIAAPDDAKDSSVPSIDDVDVPGFIDAFCSQMHPLLKRDFLRLLGFVEHVAPLAMKQTSRFTRLSAVDQDAVLGWLESNDEGLLRGAFAALKSLVFMGYYRDPRTWKIVGYGGPFVNRPERGWN